MSKNGDGPPRSVGVAWFKGSGWVFNAYATIADAVAEGENLPLVRYDFPAKRRITLRDLERLGRKINDPSTKAERSRFDAAMSKPAKRRRKGGGR